MEPLLDDIGGNSLSSGRVPVGAACDDRRRVPPGEDCSAHRRRRVDTCPRAAPACREVAAEQHRVYGVLVDDSDGPRTSRRLAPSDALSAPARSRSAAVAAPPASAAVVVQSPTETLEWAERVRATIADTPGWSTWSADKRAPPRSTSPRRPAADRLVLHESAIGQIVAQAFRSSPGRHVATAGRPRRCHPDRPAGRPSRSAQADAGPFGRYASLPSRAVAAVDEVDGPLEVTLDGARSVTVPHGRRVQWAPPRGAARRLAALPAAGALFPSGLGERRQD